MGPPKTTKMNKQSKQPRSSLRALFRQLGQLATAHNSSGKLAVAVAVGVLIGCSPLFGLHALIGIATARLLRLNQIAVFLGEQISIAPLAPLVLFLQLQAGHRLRSGRFLELSPRMIDPHLAGQLLGDWLVGFASCGPALAALLGTLTYFVLSISRRRQQKPS